MRILAGSLLLLALLLPAAAVATEGEDACAKALKDANRIIEAAQWARGDTDCSNSIRMELQSQELDRIRTDVETRCVSHPDYYRTMRGLSAAEEILQNALSDCRPTKMIPGLPSK